MKNSITRPPEQIHYPKMRRNQPLMLTQLGIIMIVLVIGLLLGTIIFLIEVLKKSKKEERVLMEDDGIEMITAFNKHSAPAHEILTDIVDNLDNS